MLNEKQRNEYLERFKYDAARACFAMTHCYAHFENHRGTPVNVCDGCEEGSCTSQNRQVAPILFQQWRRANRMCLNSVSSG